VVDRYRRLLDFYGKVAFDPEAQWVANRLKRIAGSGGIPSATQKN
jgi:hypothetical protein